MADADVFHATAENVAKAVFVTLSGVGGLVGVHNKCHYRPPMSHSPLVNKSQPSFTWSVKDSYTEFQQFELKVQNIFQIKYPNVPTGERTLAMKKQTPNLLIR